MVKAPSFVVQNPEILELYSCIQSAAQTLKDDVQLVNTLRVPEMVVIGSQSAGKTSFIESMVGFRVGPTARDTATRCPVRYVLRRKGSQANYFVDDIDVGAGDNLQMKREALRKAVYDKMDRMCRTGFSDQPIVVKIEDPSVVNMDIVDLPGLKASSTDAGAQEISDMVERYLTNQNVIPVVIAKAEKSSENNLDIDQLEKLGLQLANAVIVVNQFNRQLIDLHSISDVQQYMTGYKQKFARCRDLKFVMLLHNITGNPINKEDMSQEEVEEYYTNLPVNELDSFREHLQSFKSAGTLPPELMKDVGVSQAHGTMVSILQKWTVENGHQTAAKMKLALHPLQSQEDQLVEQIRNRDAMLASLEQQIDKYAMSYLSVMKGLRIGKQLVVPLAVKGGYYRQKNIVVNNHSCKISFMEELGKYSPMQETQVLWQTFARLPAELKNTFTGDLMAQKLPCNKGIERLLSAVGYVVMRAEMNEFSEEEIEGLTADKEGMFNAIDFAGVVCRIVQQNLLDLFPHIFSFVLHHARQLIELPVRVAHQILIQNSFPDMAEFNEFPHALDEQFKLWVRDQCIKCSESMQDMLEEKIAGVSVDIDTRLISLLALAGNAEEEMATIPGMVRATAPATGIGGLHSASVLSGHAATAGVVPPYAEPSDSEETSSSADGSKSATLGAAAVAGTTTGAPESGMRYRYQSNALEINKRIRAMLFAEQHDPTDADVGLQELDFVEGGLVDISKLEYRQNKNIVNRFAKKYFHFYKGLILLDMECKVKHYLLKQLQHTNGGDDRLHDTMKEVAARMRIAPRVSEIDVDDAEEPAEAETNVDVQLAPIERLRKKIGGKQFESEIRSVRLKIRRVEDVLTHLQSVMYKNDGKFGFAPPSRL